MKCIVCDKLGSYIIDGTSSCKKHKEMVAVIESYNIIHRVRYGGVKKLEKEML